jgi:hypothetical protein
MFGEIPIEIGSNPKSQYSFDAFTDNKKIFININKPVQLEKEFRGIVVPNYLTSANVLYSVPKKISDRELEIGLEFDNFLLLMFHELLHPKVCPNSKEDQKQITKSLYEGIKDAEPSISPKDVLYKVNNCKNLIWDVVVNSDFIGMSAGMHNDLLAKRIGYVFQKRNRRIEDQLVKHYPNGILPITHLIAATENTTDIPVSLTGAMYAKMSYNDSNVRKNALKIFLDYLNIKGLQTQNVNETLKEMYLGFVSDVNRKSLTEANIDIKNFKDKVEKIKDVDSRDYNENQTYLLETITKIFDTPSLRYDSLKGFIKPISKYIPTTQKCGSPDPNTTGYGDGEGEGEKSQDEMDSNSMSSTLDDLLGTLDEKEKDNLLGDITNEDYSGRTGRNDPLNKAKKSLSFFAADEYYKKNADAIEVHSPRTESTSTDAGLRKKWKPKSSKVLTETELVCYDINKILTFQNATGLPTLINLGNGYYRLNEYKLVETKIKSHTISKTGIETPDNWVSLIDSSGSMTQTKQYVGSNNKYDLLMRVLYGLEKGLHSACKTMGKDINYGIVNFSNSTRYSGMDSFVKIFESHSHPAKQIKLEPECGDTILDNRIFSRIKKDIKPGKTVFTQITDGELSDTNQLYEIIDNLGRQKDTAYLFIEIDSESDIGSRLKSLSKVNKGVQYYHVRNVKEIQGKLQSVLIQYT